MDKSKHTPGPWTVRVDSYGVKIHKVNGQSVTIARTYAASSDSVANAHRIVECVNGCEGITDPSAVKDLLAALKDVALAMHGYPQGLQDRISAAIAKARGLQ